MSRNSPREPQLRWLVLALSIALVTFARMGRSQEIRSSIGTICEKCGVTGGLCVQVGSDDLAVALELAQTGRVLVEILDTDAAKVERARKQIHSEDLYGLISANRWASGTRLPYTENLVNLVLIEEDRNVPLAEAVRVLRPAGVVLAKGDRAPESVLKEAGLEDVQTVRAGGDWTNAGEFGAWVSKLYQLLSEGRYDVKLTPDELKRITLWLDCNSNFYGAHHDLEKQAQGEVIQPSIE